MTSGRDELGQLRRHVRELEAKREMPVCANSERFQPFHRQIAASCIDVASPAVQIPEAFAHVDEEFRAKSRDCAFAGFDWDDVILRWEDVLPEAARSTARGGLPARLL